MAVFNFIGILFVLSSRNEMDVMLHPRDKHASVFSQS